MTKSVKRYLLEAVGAPLVPASLFYDQGEAMRWIDTATFPKVFKLRTGAGSANVRLVRTKTEARNMVKQAFAKGFRPAAGYANDARKRLVSARRRRNLLAAVTRLPKTLANIRRLNLELGHERGYIYFQDFVPNNQFDTRVTIIGRRAFAYTRNVRPGDFRASGSGDIVYDTSRIQRKCLVIAFEVARRLGSQSMAFDFVLTAEGQPMLVEVSYCFVPEFVERCAGHWDDQLEWHQGHMWPQDAILIDLLKEADQRVAFERPWQADPLRALPPASVASLPGAWPRQRDINR